MRITTNIILAAALVSVGFGGWLGIRTRNKPTPTPCKEHVWSGWQINDETTNGVSRTRHCWQCPATEQWYQGYTVEWLDCMPSCVSLGDNYAPQPMARRDYQLGFRSDGVMVWRKRP